MQRTLYVGSDSKCDIIDPKLASFHCTITIHENLYIAVRDLGTTDGFLIADGKNTRQSVYSMMSFNDSGVMFGTYDKLNHPRVWYYADLLDLFIKKFGEPIFHPDVIPGGKPS